MSGDTNKCTHKLKRKICAFQYVFIFDDKNIKRYKLMYPHFNSFYEMYIRYRPSKNGNKQIWLSKPYSIDIDIKV